MDGPWFPISMEAVKPCFSASEKREMYHVQLSGPTVALNQPVTEVSILTLKTPENSEAVVELLAEASEKTGKMLVFGKTREDENKYIVICGWSTAQAHWDHIAQPEPAAAVAKLYSLTNKEHVITRSCTISRLSQAADAMSIVIVSGKSLGDLTVVMLCVRIVQW
ncbi:hypothetical protein JVU11DRAFT_11583 [Chiua virens]|nr:hypothetical protein JVU11DRAFT_11583 [Chiua virens]